MKDDITGSVWSHLDGVALRGLAEGTRMEFLPLLHATWEEWLSLHPDTLVLSEDTLWKGRYRDRRIGGGGLGRSFVESLTHWDSRLPQATLVLGAESHGLHRAYPLKVLDAHGGVVNDDIGGAPVVAWYSEEAVSAMAFSRAVGSKTLEFRSLGGGEFQDDETGSVWDLQGLAVSGPLAGSRLSYVVSFITEWYGWAAFHPKTEIYDYALAEEIIGRGSESPPRRGW